MQDPFEPTPLAFHNRVEQKLSELQRNEKRVVRSYRRAVILAAALLICGTALALENLGVLHFFTHRYEWSIDAETIVQPTAQSCDSSLLNAVLRDAFWDGETLSIAMHIEPKDASTAFYIETDVGTDGESFDKIWWKGEILPFEEWRNGRKTIELLLPNVTANVPCELWSWDWVQDEQGETMLITLNAEDMTQGATLTIALESRVSDTDQTETATLTAVLPAMTKGEIRK